MEIKYQLTYDDYLDAQTAHAKRAAKQRKPAVRKMTRVIFIIELVLILLIGGLFWLITKQFGSPFPALAGSFLGVTSTSLVVVPWLGLFFLLALVGVTQRIPRRAGFLMLTTMLVIVGVAILCFAMAAAAGWPISLLFSFSNLVGWFALLCLGLPLAMASVKRAATYWQKQQPNLSRPKTVKFRQDGFCVVDEVSKRDHLWAAVENVVDSPALVLLYYNPLMFEIIPKRAFVEDQSLEQFWRFVGSKGEANPTGFDVRPAIPLANRFEPTSETIQSASDTPPGPG